VRVYATPDVAAVAGAAARPRPVERNLNASPAAVVAAVVAAV
jgi:hypothetical protein